MGFREGEYKMNIFLKLRAQDYIRNPVYTDWDELRELPDCTMSMPDYPFYPLQFTLSQ